VKGPKLEEEFQFHPKRRWRADFAHVGSRTLIECEGGIHSYGRHNRASGFIKDCEKYLEATLLGWRVIRLTGDQINAGILERIARFCEAYDADDAGFGDLLA